MFSIYRIHYPGSSYINLGLLNTWGRATFNVAYYTISHQWGNIYRGPGSLKSLAQRAATIANIPLQQAEIVITAITNGEDYDELRVRLTQEIFQTQALSLIADGVTLISGYFLNLHNLIFECFNKSTKAVKEISQKFYNNFLERPLNILSTPANYQFIYNLITPYHINTGKLTAGLTFYGFMNTQHFKEVYKHNYFGSYVGCVVGSATMGVIAGGVGTLAALSLTTFLNIDTRAQNESQKDSTYFQNAASPYYYTAGLLGAGTELFSHHKMNIPIPFARRNYADSKPDVKDVIKFVANAALNSVTVGMIFVELFKFPAATADILTVTHYHLNIGKLGALIVFGLTMNSRTTRANYQFSSLGYYADSLCESATMGVIAGVISTLAALSLTTFLNIDTRAQNEGQKPSTYFQDAASPYYYTAGLLGVGSELFSHLKRNIPIPLVRQNYADPKPDGKDVIKFVADAVLNSVTVGYIFKELFKFPAVTADILTVTPYHLNIGKLGAAATFLITMHFKSAISIYQFSDLGQYADSIFAITTIGTVAGGISILAALSITTYLGTNTHAQDEEEKITTYFQDKVSPYYNIASLLTAGMTLYSSFTARPPVSFTRYINEVNPIPDNKDVVKLVTNGVLKSVAVGVMTVSAINFLAVTSDALTNNPQLQEQLSKVYRLFGEDTTSNSITPSQNVASSEDTTKTLIEKSLDKSDETAEILIGATVDNAILTVE